MLPLIFLSLVFGVQRPTDVVKWSAEGSIAGSTTARVVHVKVTADIQPGWKLYALQQPEGGPKPLAFATPASAPFRITAPQIVAPKAKVQKQDANFAVDTHYYEGQAAFTIPVSVNASVPAGGHEIPLEVTFQACGAELCLRPFTQKLPVKISVGK